MRLLVKRLAWFASLAKLDTLPANLSTYCRDRGPDASATLKRPSARFFVFFRPRFNIILVVEKTMPRTFPFLQLSNAFTHAGSEGAISMFGEESCCLRASRIGTAACPMALSYMFIVLDLHLVWLTFGDTWVGRGNIGNCDFPHSLSDILLSVVMGGQCTS